MRAKSVFLLTLIIFSCKQQEKKQPEKEEKATPQEKILSFEDFGKEVQQIVKSQDGVFRGIEFGYSPSEVRGTETAYHLETGENYITYGMDFNLDENADFEYFFDKDSTLNKIESVIYFSTDTASARVFDDFVKYYEWKLGESIKISPTQYFWETANRTHINLKRVLKGRSADILIEFIPPKEQK